MILIYRNKSLQPIDRAVHLPEYFSYDGHVDVLRKLPRNNYLDGIDGKNRTHLIQMLPEIIELRRQIENKKYPQNGFYPPRDANTVQALILYETAIINPEMLQRLSSIPDSSQTCLEYLERAKRMLADLS